MNFFLEVITLVWFSSFLFFFILLLLFAGEVSSLCGNKRTRILFPSLSAPMIGSCLFCLVLLYREM